MKKKHKIIFVVVLVLIAVLVLRETGIIDFHLYKSQSKAHHTGTMATQGNTSGSFDVAINWKKSNHESYNTSENIIMVNLNKFHVSGNTWWPFHKNGTASYDFDYSTRSGNIKGDIQGKVTMRVSGICSHSKLVELMKKEIEKNINQYFEERLKAK